MMDLNTSDGGSFRTKAGLILSSAFVAAAFCLWPHLGNTGAYLALIAAVPALLLAVDTGVLRTLAGARWIWMLWCAFALLSAAFLMQPQRTSLPAIGDFALFALAPLLGIASFPFARQVSVERLSGLLLLSAALCAWVGWAGVMAGQSRVGNAELSPIHFADLALLVGFMALAGTLGKWGRWTWLLYLGPIFALVAAIASNTRSALLVALALASLYALFWLRARPWSLMAKLAVLGAALVLTVASFVLAQALGFARPLSAIEPVWAVLRGELPADSSSIYRVEMYLSGLRAFWDAPLVGHGWHNQLQAALPYMSEVGRQGYASEPWGYIHSDLLSFAVAAGLPGALAYFLMLSAPLVAAIQADGGAKAGSRLYLAAALSLGLFTSGLTDALFMVEVPKLLLVVTSALVFAGAAAPNRESELA